MGGEQLQQRHRTVFAAIIVVSAIGSGMSAAPSLARASGPNFSASKSHVTVGHPVVFTGRVAAKHSIVVDLQKFGKSWNTVASTSSHRHAFKFRWIVTAPGVQRYRAKVSSRASRTVTVTGYKWHYLSSTRNVGNNCNCQGGHFEINGVTFRHTLFDKGTFGSVHVDYNLRRQCTRFQATVGLGDNSSSSATALMEAAYDGNTFFSQVFALGESTPVAQDITGHLRLRLHWHKQRGNVDVGYGDAEIYCSF